MFYLEVDVLLREIRLLQSNSELVEFYTGRFFLEDTKVISNMF